MGTDFDFLHINLLYCGGMATKDTCIFVSILYICIASFLLTYCRYHYQALVLYKKGEEYLTNNIVVYVEKRGNLGTGGNLGTRG